MSPRSIELRNPALSHKRLVNINPTQQGASECSSRQRRRVSAFLAVFLPVQPSLHRKERHFRHFCQIQKPSVTPSGRNSEGGYQHRKRTVRRAAAPPGSPPHTSLSDRQTFSDPYPGLPGERNQSCLQLPSRSMHCVRCGNSSEMQRFLSDSLVWKARFSNAPCVESETGSESESESERAFVSQWRTQSVEHCACWMEPTSQLFTTFVHFFCFNMSATSFSEISHRKNPFEEIDEAAQRSRAPFCLEGSQHARNVLRCACAVQLSFAPVFFA